MRPSVERQSLTHPAMRPFERALVYLAAADDPGITILPTHRLVRPGPGIAFSLDDLWARLDDVYETLPAADGRAALAAAHRCGRRTTRLRWSRTTVRRCSAVHGVSVGRRVTVSTSRSSKPRCSSRPA